MDTIYDQALLLSMGGPRHSRLRTFITGLKAARTDYIREGDGPSRGSWSGVSPVDVPGVLAAGAAALTGLPAQTGRLTYISGQ